MGMGALQCHCCSSRHGDGCNHSQHTTAENYPFKPWGGGGVKTPKTIQFNPVWWIHKAENYPVQP